MASHARFPASFYPSKLRQLHHEPRLFSRVAKDGLTGVLFACIGSILSSLLALGSDRISTAIIAENSPSGPPSSRAAPQQESHVLPLFYDLRVISLPCEQDASLDATLKRRQHYVPFGGAILPTGYFRAAGLVPTWSMRPVMVRMIMSTFYQGKQRLQYDAGHTRNSSLRVKVNPGW
ncbi:hypothetical protein GGI42DRAFT_100135 [Trichoderma sp. SZMC 28013]